MPTRVETLRRRADFLALRSGPRRSTPAFTVQVSRHPADREPPRETLRAGYTVTKKVGIAVERNRIKRRLRPIVRAVATTLDSSVWAGRDLVLIARREALARDAALMQHDLADALARLEAKLESGSPEPQIR